ncbi:MAG TPA: YceI family protein [Ferruginibacter sp.]|nr:YceI family protein [Ferruginibacter sp.]
MKKTILSMALLLAGGLVFAQKKTTTSAIINFDATTSLDALPKAENKTVIALLDTKTGKLAFEATVQGFNFENPKIQEHFNGKGWMDSEQFPTSTFSGTIINLTKVNFTKDGIYNVEVAGYLTMHGVKKPVETKAIISVKGTAITASSNFSIKLADYGVNGAAIAAGKVSKEPKINVSAVF